MILDMPNPASVAARTGSGDAICFDSECPRSKKQINQQVQNRLRRQRSVECVHRLGPAPLFHLLTDLDSGKPVWPTVECYAALPADFIRANGGDRFAPSLWPIDGGRR
jgi:hypothetical protein